MAGPSEHPSLESLNSSNAGAELPSWSEQQLDPSYPPTHITTASMDQLEVPCATKAQPTASTDAPEAGSPQQPIPAFSQEFLLKAAAKQGHRLPRSPALQQKLLAKLTHLHLNALQLQQLSSIRLCSRLQVLYLYDNQLSSISSLGSNRLITHLYLQNNQLQSLDGLQDLPLLQKLYLQNNQLAVISHLAAATKLEELHMSDQRWLGIARMASRTDSSMMQLLSMESSQQQKQQAVQEGSLQQQLPDKEPDEFGPAQSGTSTPEAAEAAEGAADEPQELAVLQTGALGWEAASLRALSHNLRVLVVSNCGITDPGPFEMLRSLLTLDLSNNLISRIESLQQPLHELHQLRSLDLRGNDCVHEVKYRDYVILLASDALATLDGEAVPATHRAYLLRLHVNKLKAQGRSEQQKPQLQLHGQGPGKITSGQQQQSPAAAVAREAAHAGSIGLAGMGVKLHPCKAPAARPPAVAGFKLAAVRVGVPAANHLTHQQLGHEGGLEPELTVKELRLAAK